jgi:hypothetical protein
MPVDKKLLEDCILEAAGDDAEMAKFLRERYTANDALAAKFVGGFMRSSDYTQKTTALANDRKQIESVNGQLATVRKALEDAEKEKNAILQDLAKHRVSTAKAKALMEILRDKYQLDDNDLPGMSDLIETAKTGKKVDSTEDLDSRFASFKETFKREIEADFVKTLMPELGSMASLPIVWNEIAREHEELTGKRLTAAEQQDILKAARESNSSLRAVWEDKFKIGGDDGLRMQKRDERLKQSWQQDAEKAAADARSKAALEVVSGPPKPEFGDGPNISAAFKTNFRTFEMDPNKPGEGKPGEGKPGEGSVPGVTVLPGQHVRQTGGQRVPAAQRAAQKFLEKGGPAGYAKKAS